MMSTVWFLLLFLVFLLFSYVYLLITLPLPWCTGTEKSLKTILLCDSDTRISCEISFWACGLSKSRRLADPLLVSFDTDGTFFIDFYIREKGWRLSYRF